MNTLNIIYEKDAFSKIKDQKFDLSIGLKNYTFETPLYLEKGYIPVVDQDQEIAVETSGLASFCDILYLEDNDNFINQKINTGSNWRFYFRLLVRELTSKKLFFP